MARCLLALGDDDESIDSQTAALVIAETILMFRAVLIGLTAKK